MLSAGFDKQALSPDRGTVAEFAVSVVICTYNRPRMLTAAVASCLNQATSRGLKFEIIIADNSPQGHATDLAERLAADDFPVRRVSVSPANISLARNAGLRMARAPLVAFLDDDLEVEPGWLDAFVDTLTESGADVALGRLRPRFAVGGPPIWDRQALRFNRNLAAPSGTRLIAGGPNRTRGFAMTTATSIWRTATCFTDPAPFDPAFGASGGEDFDLFLRLEARGRRFVWCAESLVSETIPQERSTLSYNVLRAYSGSQAYAAATIKNASNPLLAGSDVMLRGAAQSLVFGVLTLLLLPLGGARWQTRLIAASASLGKLLWFRKLGLYQAEKAPAQA
jgi:succinoglycan biosynthesis protein ExoM